jgi:hypothetical protein
MLPDHTPYRARHLRRTTRTSRRSSLSRFGRLVSAPVRAVHTRIAARLDGQDATARARGWTVETLPRGGRVYRDPRFDQLTHNRTQPVSVGRGAGG